MFVVVLQIEELGGSAIVCAGDMSKEDDVEALFKAVSFPLLHLQMAFPHARKNRSKYG